MTNGEDEQLLEQLNEKILVLQEKVVQLEQDKRDIMANTPHEVSTLKRVLCDAIMGEMNAYRIKLLFGAAFGIGDTPEMQQLHETHNDLQEFKQKMKKQFRIVMVVVGSLAGGLMVGIDIQTIMKFFLDLIELLGELLS